ncbi:MAG: hypothetical protein HY898_34215 [Deltaproteobacteria bacterium]|nr:hypothetical protein [Deltaproteobacteria bacterium]
MNPGAEQAAVKPVVRTEVDPELLALPAPPRRDRTLAVVLMLVTAVASISMCWALRGEVSYAFSRAVPAELGDLTTLQLGSVAPGSYVEARGLLGTNGAIRYSRPLEGDSFRLQPVAGNDKLWVEIRVPEGMEGPRFIPPISFAGRLSPMKSAGLRHAGLARSVHAQTSVVIPQDAWILVDGASPRASRWAVALFALFAFFAAWNVVNTIRIVRRVSDR